MISLPKNLLELEPGDIVISMAWGRSPVIWSFVDNGMFNVTFRTSKGIEHRTYQDLRTFFIYDDQDPGVPL